LQIPDLNSRTWDVRSLKAAPGTLCSRCRLTPQHPRNHQLLAAAGNKIGKKSYVGRIQRKDKGTGPQAIFSAVRTQETGNQHSLQRAYKTLGKQGQGPFAATKALCRLGYPSS